MTTTYTDYPFTVNGVNFISRIYSNYPQLKTIQRLPKDEFIKMNVDAITQLIGDASLFTRDELLNELARINEGGTTAFILLDEGAM